MAEDKSILFIEKSLVTRTGRVIKQRFGNSWIWQLFHNKPSEKLVMYMLCTTGMEFTLEPAPHSSETRSLCCFHNSIIQNAK